MKSTFVKAIVILGIAFVLPSLGGTFIYLSIGLTIYVIVICNRKYREISMEQKTDNFKHLDAVQTRELRRSILMKMRSLEPETVDKMIKISMEDLKEDKASPELLDLLDKAVRKYHLDGRHLGIAVVEEAYKQLHGEYPKLAH